MQFIPIVEFQGFEQTAPPGPAAPVVTEWSVDPDDYGYFLCRIFDRWLSQDRGTIFVNHFETLVSQHLGLGSPMCTYHDFCGKNLAVEHDGSVYSCDHYVYPAYRLGSVQEGQLGALAFSAPQVAFGYAKSDTLPQYCRACQHLRDCWGECPKNRIARTPDGEPGLNYLCRGLKAFFTHAVPEVDRLAATLRQQSLHPRARTS